MYNFVSYLVLSYISRKREVLVEPPFFVSYFLYLYEITLK